MSGDYVVDLVALDRSVAERACRLFVDRIGPRATAVWIDAFSDVADLPPTAEAAGRELLARRPHGMGIELDMDDETDRRLLDDFALWSIHVELLAGQSLIGSIHDSGDSLWFVGDDEDAASFGALGIQLERRTAPAPRRQRWRPQSSGSSSSG